MEKGERALEVDERYGGIIDTALIIEVSSEISMIFKFERMRRIPQSPVTRPLANLAAELVQAIREICSFEHQEKSIVYQFKVNKTAFRTDEAIHDTPTTFLGRSPHHSSPRLRQAMTALE
jgi:hypothetical protein